MVSKSDVKACIAAVISELRKTRGWNQEELGNKFNPPRKKATVSSWESGRTTPDADTLVELCGIFGVDIQDFYPKSVRDGVQVVPNEDEVGIIMAFRASSKEGKAAISAVANAMADMNS